MPKKPSHRFNVTLTIDTTDVDPNSKDEVDALRSNVVEAILDGIVCDDVNVTMVEPEEQ